MVESLENFSKFIAENKGQRKFKQTVELAINFKGIDFSKQDNRINVEVILPNGKGKALKIGVFATDRTIAEEARKNGIEVIDGNDIEKISKDATRLNTLLDYELMAQPSLMPVVAKNLGQFLGPRNKMPKPLIGSAGMANLANELNKRISIKNKGKFLPTVHCIVGSEDMDANKIYDNVREVLNGVTKKVGGTHVRSAYVKLTMSKPFRVA
ncbi:MAG: 50S ribosomal protein L1 [Candidatus Marsarchaeota archaeon]|nr:50S ribosomal protein L1 [Candidatus Marsarchaeota archaeon]MCL5413367.1 50S ribosomal protein L1 [Candidatus Marsarchaeota archaeon]